MDKLTDKMTSILAVMQASDEALHSAEELAEMISLPVSAQTLGGTLAWLHARGMIGKVLVIVRDLTTVMVPGKAVGRYSVGMVPVPKRKTHWFLPKNRSLVAGIRKQRQEAYNSKGQHQCP